MVKRMTHWCAATLFAVSMVAGAAELPTMNLSINGHKLTAELATNTETRTVGLMHRFSLKPDYGMLFVFRDPRPLCLRERLNPLDRQHRIVLAEIHHHRAARLFVDRIEHPAAVVRHRAGETGQP